MGNAGVDAAPAEKKFKKTYYLLPFRAIKI
jgi:hypothetical protein